MDEEEGEGECPTTTALTVDLSKQMLKKIERADNEQKLASVLILNDNEIQRLDNLESFSNLKKLFLINNKLFHMYGVSQLILLEVLDISNNSLVAIEGLKDLRNLKELNLARNRIKIIEHLNNNLELQKIDVSDNSITHISDISHLKHLKVLLLHGNKLTHLRQCEKNLPENIEVLTLHNNLICDLNEISHLANFNSFKELSFLSNPCVNFSDDKNSFNYRPFIKNWCSSLITLDSQPLDDIECLKAEWLYSQGRGRSFRPGEQAALVEYLINVCPLKEQNDEAEDFKKLKLILSKAQQHQKQLREQLSTGSLPSQGSYKISRKKKVSGVPERMASSFHDSSLNDHRNSPDLMTRSLDSDLIRNSPARRESHQTPLQTSTTFIPVPDTLISPDVCHAAAPFYTSHTRPSSISSRTSGCSSRNSPHSTPESNRKTSATVLRKQSKNSSPKISGKLVTSRSNTPLELNLTRSQSPLLSSKGSSTKEIKTRHRVTSEEDDSEVAQERVQKFLLNHQQQQQQKTQKRPNKKRWEPTKSDMPPIGDSHKKQASSAKMGGDITEQKLSETRAWKAAVCIQRRWRGYRARNLSGEVLSACKDIQLSRMQDYIMKVVSEMEAARVALEGNRKLQVLQMQAINALWKKMITLQPSEPVESSNESRLTLQELMTTCINLNKQMEGLQAMMQTMQQVTQVPSQLAPIATQTEIVAVHTPHGDGKELFPFSLCAKTTDSEVDNYFLPANNKFINSDAPCDEEMEFVSSKQSDVAEIYINKNLEDKSSDQEVFLLPNQQDENDMKCSTVSLTKPLVKLNEVVRDFQQKSAAASNEENLEIKVDEESTETCDVQN